MVAALGVLLAASSASALVMFDTNHLTAREVRRVHLGERYTLTGPPRRESNTELRIDIERRACPGWQFHAHFRAAPRTRRTEVWLRAERSQAACNTQATVREHYYVRGIPPGRMSDPIRLRGHGQHYDLPRVR